MARGRPLSFDRKEALTRAMEFFWNHGYDATGLTELLEYMGISRQSFYNTVGSKENVLFESFDLNSAGLHQKLCEVQEGAQTPFEKIDRLFAMWQHMGTSGWGEETVFLRRLKKDQFTRKFRLDRGRTYGVCGPPQPND